MSPSPILSPLPLAPADGLGHASQRAALLVDAAAVQLLGACGPFDPAGERRRRVADFLDRWPEIVRAVEDLAAEATANDNQPAR